MIATLQNAESSRNLFRSAGQFLSVPRRLRVEVGCAIAVLMAGSAGSVSASIPTGQNFGPWHVWSISSVSGVDNDPAAGVSQSINGNESVGSDAIEFRWDHFGAISVNLDIRSCDGENSFHRDHEWAGNGWFALRKSVRYGKARQLLEGWIREAKVECGSRSEITTFSFSQFNDALNNFDARVAYFSGRNEKQ